MTTMTPKIKKLRTNALVLLGSVLLLGLTLLCACRQSVGKAGSAFWASGGAEADSVSARLDESARGDFDTERRQAGELLQEMSEGEASEEAWSKFSVLFSNAHPGFISTLTSRYPDLTRGEVRMACYILAGMETKQIARALNITPGSVTKSRHRLRTRLRLAPDQDIAAFLREMK